MTTRMKKPVSRYFELGMTALLSHFFRGEIRRGSIQAVKLYIRSVEAARLSAIWLLVGAIVGSLFVMGIVLTITGLLALLPLEPAAMAWTALAIGLVLTGIPVFIFAQFLSQKRWLEASKAYELMDAALGPWEGALPPNPIDIMTSQRSAKETSSAARPSPSVATEDSLRADPRPQMANARLVTPLVP